MTESDLYTLNGEVFFMKGQLGGIQNDIAGVKSDLAQHRAYAESEFGKIGDSIQDLKDVMTGAAATKVALMQVRNLAWGLLVLAVSTTATIYSGAPGWIRNHVPW